MEKELKYFICLFKIEGHSTWRMVTERSTDIIERELSKIKNVTKKKYFEIDRLTGEMEEF